MKSTHCITYQSDQVPQLSFIEKFPRERSLIQIHFWEAHILNRNVAAKFLATWSYDGGPAYSDHVDMRRISYRFTRDVWFSRIKIFLIQNRIPVSLSTDDNRMSVQLKGTTPSAERFSANGKLRPQINLTEMSN